jgi:hypothetical protein
VNGLVISAAGGGGPGELPDTCPVAGNQGLFFGAGPTLDLQLKGQSAFPAFELAQPNQLQWFACGRVARLPAVVLLHADVEIVRVPAVIRPIGTPQQIDVEWLHGEVLN